MKCIIQDKLTEEYYCVEMTEVDADGRLTVGFNDFPYWSPDIDNAVIFGSDLVDGFMSAKAEMKCNDLTCDGTRQPTILDEFGFETETRHRVIDL